LTLNEKKPAQALVEFAMVFPMILLTLLVCYQYAILFFAHLSVMNAGRDAGRWVAVHPHNPDATTVTNVKNRLPPNLDSGKMTISFSPACSAVGTDLKCANRNPGDRITTTLTYNVSNLIFFPSQFGFLNMKVTMPQSLPAYSVWTMAEAADPGA
jgi:Flp pilus assembly protein TadG